MGFRYWALTCLHDARQVNGERRAFALLALNCDVAPHHLTETTADHEPQARTDLMLCAGGDGSHDACVGDSGGPLLVPGIKPGSWTDVAITSWGAGCAAAGIPGVYTRLQNPSIAAFVASTITQ